MVGDTVYVYRSNNTINVSVAREGTLLSLREGCDDTICINTPLMPHRAWPIVRRLLQAHGVITKAVNEPLALITAKVVTVY
ncbi:MAG: hypothetical protein UT41_C0002G0110 [Candidatus Wolfebacteria bacterium GW2011_GWC2_39_22]|uniref:Uncharacterized protein n=2 Tax=Candidatus Wolfeibacteriota TaxID=1752735 RepID=A0A0G1K5Y4_9BACT|nr:MAG: hypothetical protein UT41_C0002G0110 [Candidatus Wolfebacteria bacterium GW2011_GWC2_39_22]KKT43244.1 MAG: hypothetical protein UW32_C0002G0105 [Candidatus Wolfebacteria bacterium GW2011_GWE2_44_13]